MEISTVSGISYEKPETIPYLSLEISALTVKTSKNY